MTILRIATRKSPLALWQTNFIKQQLQKLYPSLQIELVGLVTAGDKRTDVELSQIGGKSLFVKELQTALLEKNADIAVHSVKDMSVTPTPGLTLAAVCRREDARDAVIMDSSLTDWRDLPLNAVAGTASPRRQCQLRGYRPDMIIKTLRGNVGTRLQKFDQGQYDMIVLAYAGLKRLGLENRVSQLLTVEEFIPAIGQGALGIECRIDDLKMLDLIAPLDDWASHQCIKAERAVNRQLGGDCYTPVGAHAQIHGQRLTLHAMLGSMDGRIQITENASGPAEQAENIGTEVGNRLLAQRGELLS